MRPLGLLAVQPGQGVEAHLDPGPYQPRRNLLRAGKLLREFQRRVGDPNQAGSTGVKRMTAYRQDALRCLTVLADGAMKGADVARATGVLRATTLMRDDHYGWFERMEKGVYGLTIAGQAALAAHAAEIARLKAPE